MATYWLDFWSKSQAMWSLSMGKSRAAKQAWCYGNGLLCPPNTCLVKYIKNKEKALRYNNKNIADTVNSHVVESIKIGLQVHQLNKMLCRIFR